MQGGFHPSPSSARANAKHDTESAIYFTPPQFASGSRRWRATARRGGTGVVGATQEEPGRYRGPNKSRKLLSPSRVHARLKRVRRAAVVTNRRPLAPESRHAPPDRNELPPQCREFGGPGDARGPCPAGRVVPDFGRAGESRPRARRARLGCGRRARRGRRRVVQPQRNVRSRRPPEKPPEVTPRRGFE